MAPNLFYADKLVQTYRVLYTVFLQNTKTYLILCFYSTTLNNNLSLYSCNIVCLVYLSYYVYCSLGFFVQFYNVHFTK